MERSWKIQKNDRSYDASEQLQSGFCWPNWGSMEQRDDTLDPASGSIACSPAGSNDSPAVNSVGDKLIIRKVIGRLACRTPLNSPAKLNLSVANPDIEGSSSFYERNFPVRPSSKPFSSDLEIARRVAGFSCFAAGNGVPGNQISTIREFESQIKDHQERRKSSIEFRNSIPNKKSRNQSSPSTCETAERGDSREVPSLFQQISYCGTAMKEEDEVDPNSRKRKSSSMVKLEEPPSTEIAMVNEGIIISGEDENQKNTKLPEPAKDYIHVRARRGQATDSHSLAERVRREKISERMKFLQDLVPGCNKVTGKAVVLDEIINYVQALQRQVECLSMKLASVNPRMMNLNMAALVSKDISQSSASLLNIPSETEIQYPLNSLQCRNQQMQMIHVDGHSKDEPQVLPCWEDDLQSLVQMGFGQNLRQNLHC